MPLTQADLCLPFVPWRAGTAPVVTKSLSLLAQGYVRDSATLGWHWLASHLQGSSTFRDEFVAGPLCWPAGTEPQERCPTLYTELRFLDILKVIARTINIGCLFPLWRAPGQRRRESDPLGGRYVL